MSLHQEHGGSTGHYKGKEESRLYDVNQTRVVLDLPTTGLDLPTPGLDPM